MIRNSVRGFVIKCFIFDVACAVAILYMHTH